jgi:hypothetical protein
VSKGLSVLGVFRCCIHLSLSIHRAYVQLSMSYFTDYCVSSNNYFRSSVAVGVDPAVGCWSCRGNTCCGEGCWSLRLKTLVYFNSMRYIQGSILVF